VQKVLYKPKSYLHPQTRFSALIFVILAECVEMSLCSPSVTAPSLHSLFL